MKIEGAIGSYPEYYITKNFDKNSIVVTNTEKRAVESVNDLTAYNSFFQKKINIRHYPQSTDKLDIESQIKRNYALYSLLHKNSVIVLSKEALNVPIRTKERFLKDLIRLETGKDINRDAFIEQLFKNGYIREDFIENEGEFSVKGGMVSVFIPFIGVIDIDFFGDTVENIFLKSKLLTRKKIDSIDIFPLYDFPVKDITEFQFEEIESSTLKDFIDEEDIYYIDLMEDVLGIPHTSFIPHGFNPDVSTKDENGDYQEIKLPLKRELILKSTKQKFISTDEKKLELDIEPLQEGDYIIHEDYGIGIYRGIVTKEIRGKNYDFMILEYANNEKIYVSYLHFDKIFKYKTSGIVSLDKIGGTSWRNLKKKVKNSLKNVAKDLIKLYSERQKAKRKPLNIQDELIYNFEREFPYVETPDQRKAILDIKKDFQKENPMERVICGDVGFGKTEVALRGTFISVINGKQVAVLVPTTVLSYQHFKTFKERLEPFGIVVENLSRLKTKKEQEQIFEKLKEGKIDVIVGTHKLLNENLKFKNLGLVIIDEEHRFGVRAKEKLKKLKKNVDVIYMTATPIPRTLNMALSGLKDLSVINIPPEGRIATKTFVVRENEKILKEAIKKELDRDGQVFYIHNRIETIEQKTEELKKMFPSARIKYIHGQMKPKQIEKIILEFIEQKIDILVSTSIIETGIDIPTANTLIIERADLFGLAQLYHLRGRVGRGNIQAYCYLLLPSQITENAQKRINAITKLTRPGSGLKISIEDMQIRGPGNILGVEQSGNIKAVGFEMFTKLLKEAIEEEKGENSKEPEIITDIESYIPENFIQNAEERMNIYLSLSKLESSEEIENLKKYLSEFYNELPVMFDTYLELTKLKTLLKELNVQKLELKEPVSKMFIKDIKPEIVIELIQNLDIIKVDSEYLTFRFKKEDLKKFVNFIEKLKEKPE